MAFNEKETIGNAIRKYLERIGLEEFFVRQKQINFIYNALTISLDDNTEVGKFIPLTTSATIIVHITNNLIGN